MTRRSAKERTPAPITSAAGDVSTSKSTRPQEPSAPPAEVVEKKTKTRAMTRRSAQERTPARIKSAAGDVSTSKSTSPPEPRTPPVDVPNAIKEGPASFLHDAPLRTSTKPADALKEEEEHATLPVSSPHSEGAYARIEPGNSEGPASFSNDAPSPTSTKPADVIKEDEDVTLPAGSPHGSSRSTSTKPSESVAHSFYGDALKEGYQPDFLAKILCPQDREAVSRQSSTGLDMSSKDLQAFLMKLIKVDSVKKRRQMVRKKINAGTLGIHTRIDMEIVARLIGGFCYSACVASSHTFCQDILDCRPLRGNTWETLRRLQDHEKCKMDLRDRGDPVTTEDLSTPKTVTLYFDDEHISRYPFTNPKPPFARALKTDTGVVKRIAQLCRDCEKFGEREPLVEACLENPSNESIVLDMTGKPKWLLAKLQRYRAEQKRQG